MITPLIHKMAVNSTISIPPKELQSAIDNALEKVAKQLRELNHYVRLYSSLQRSIMTDREPYLRRFGLIQNWHMKSTRPMMPSATSLKAKDSQLPGMPTE